MRTVCRASEQDCANACGSSSRVLCENGVLNTWLHVTRSRTRETARDERGPLPSGALPRALALQVGAHRGAVVPERVILTKVR